MNTRFQPDPHRNRKPIPLTRSEYESWAREREIGRSKYIRKSIIAGAFAFPSTLAVFAVVIMLTKGVALQQGWEVFAMFSAVVLIVAGGFLGWFMGGHLWQIAEDRFAVTEAKDFDDEELLGKSKEDRLLAWSMLPGAIGMGLMLFLPERFASVFFIGGGLTMIAFGYICLRSKHTYPKDGNLKGDSVGKGKSTFILIIGVGVFCAGVAGLF